MRENRALAGASNLLGYDTNGNQTINNNIKYTLLAIYTRTKLIRGVGRDNIFIFILTPGQLGIASGFPDYAFPARNSKHILHRKLLFEIFLQNMLRVTKNKLENHSLENQK